MIETVLVIIIIIGLLIKSTIKPKNAPPGPIPLPLIGNIMYVDFKNPQRTWKILREKYGDIVSVGALQHKLVIVNGWNAIMEVMMNDELAGRPDVCILSDLSDEGLKTGVVFTDGSVWRLQKRFTVHNFRNLGFGKKAHETVIQDEVENLISELEELKGTPTTVERKLALSIINIIWCMTGGKRYRRSDPELHELANAIDEIMRCFSIIGGPVVILPFLRYVFPTQTRYNILKKSRKVVAKFIEDSIRDHLNQNCTDIDDNDFIGCYLKEMGKANVDESFSKQQLVGICRDLLLAGTDSSANTICFGVMLLCVHPEIQEKMFQEILNVVGTNRLPLTEDKQKLIYVNAFINEVLRFRTISPTFIPHRAMVNTKLQGYDIPKDTLVYMNFESILMDRDYWGDPEKFRPERFISKDGKLINEERLINFGRGKRICGGEKLGRANSFLILASLVQKFSIRFPEGEIPESTEGVVGFTFSAPDFKAIFAPRINEYLA